MAEKRYFFLKLPDDFFQSLKIKKLRRLAGGDTYTIIYLKMQLLSLKNGGYLTYEGVEDDLADELALMLDESPEDIKMTMAFMSSNGLMESTDNPDKYLLPEAAASFINEGRSAERVRRYRERQKALPKPNVDNALHCNANVTPETLQPVTCNQTCYGEIEIEKELEQESEKEKEKTCAPSGASSSGKGKPSKKEADARAAIMEYTENLNLQETLGQFLEMRREIKKPMSGKAMKMLTSKLDNLASSDAEKIAMLEESIINGWQSVWPLKNQPAQPKKAVPDCLNWGKEGNLH